MADALLGGNGRTSSDYNIVAFVSVRRAPAVYWGSIELGQVSHRPTIEEVAT